MATTLAWEEPATAKGFRRLASFAPARHLRPAGDRAFGPLRPADAPALDGPGGGPRSGDRCGGGDRSRPLRDPQRWRGRGPVRGPPPGAPARPVQHLGPAARRPTTSRSGSAIRSSTVSRSATGEWGQGRIYNEFGPAAATRSPAGAGRAGVDEPEPARDHLPHEPHVRHPTRPADHLGPDAGHPPGGQPEHPARPRPLHRRGHPGRPPRAPPRDGPGLPAQLRDAGHRRGGAVRHGRRHRSSSTACGPPCCSPTSSTRRPGPPRCGDERWSALIDAAQRPRCGARPWPTAGGSEEHRRRLPGGVRRTRRAVRVRCARASMEAVADLGLELRAGMHVGEVSPMGKARRLGTGRPLRPAALRAGRGRARCWCRRPCRDGLRRGRRRVRRAGKAEFKGIPGAWEVFEARP